VVSVADLPRRRRLILNAGGVCAVANGSSEARKALHRLRREGFVVVHAEAEGVGVAQHEDARLPTRRVEERAPLAFRVHPDVVLPIPHLGVQVRVRRLDAGAELVDEGRIRARGEELLRRRMQPEEPELHAELEQEEHGITGLAESAAHSGAPMSAEASRANRSPNGASGAMSAPSSRTSELPRTSGFSVRFIVCLRWKVPAPARSRRSAAGSRSSSRLSAARWRTCLRRAWVRCSSSSSPRRTAAHRPPGSR